jgi:ABC-type amino acid transport substrate-binding protein
MALAPVRVLRATPLALLARTALLVCLLANAALAHAQQLRSIAQQGAPVKYAALDEQRPGLCRELALQVQRFDPQLSITGLDNEAPLRRVELMLERGEIDVFFCLIDTRERRRRFDFLSVPIYRVRHVVVQRADDPTLLADHRDLALAGRRKPVLVAQGSVLAQRLSRAGVPFSEAARNDIAALRMLLLGRSDAVYGQDMTLAPLLRLPEFEGRLRIGEAVFDEERQYVAVDRRLPGATRLRLETALAALERSGALRDLAQKYHWR